MLKWLRELFKPTPHPPVSITINAGWTPEALEARIEEAGRAEVFDEARRLGWDRYSSPPMWVWGAIANDIIAKKAASEPRTLH